MTSDNPDSAAEIATQFAYYIKRCWIEALSNTMTLLEVINAFSGGNNAPIIVSG